jgi:hypothetical protein
MGAPFAWGARRAPFETLSAPPRPVEGSYTQGYGVSHEGRCGRRAWATASLWLRGPVHGAWSPCCESTLSRPSIGHSGRQVRPPLRLRLRAAWL